ncbi:peptide chain release factor N(5)-glutamine methyltransferase [soil metagenome]
MTALSIGDAVLKSTGYLEKKSVESARLDAELLLAKIMGCDRLRLYMDWQKPLTELEIAAYRDFIRRRGEQREPVARITGRKQFYGREFEITPDTFVPRPETEGVVERALSLLQTDPALTRERQNIFEIGTGTGCIIVSIAAETDVHHFIASDVLPGAIATARRNAKTHGVEGRIDFRNAPYFAGFEGTLGLIVSNPPYIESHEIPTLEEEVRSFDPMSALDGGPDGLDAVRVIAAEAAQLLFHGGWTVLELGEGQAHAAADIFRAVGGYDDFRIEKDLAGIDRYLMVRKG